MQTTPRREISSAPLWPTTLALLLACFLALFLAACSPVTSPVPPIPSQAPATGIAPQPATLLPRPAATTTSVSRLPPSKPPELIRGLIALWGYDGDLYVLSLDCMARLEGCDTALKQSERPGSFEWFPALSPDGERLAFVSDRGVDSGESIYLTDLRTGTSRRLTLEPGWFRDLAWAPDGHSLAFSFQREDGGPQTIATINIEGGGLSPFPQVREHMVAPTWSPDGHSIAFLGADNWPTDPYSYLYVSDVSGASIRQLGPSQPVFYGPAQWSPEGTRLLASISPRQDLALIDVQSSETTFITNTAPEEDAPSWSPDGKWIAYSVFDEGTWRIDVRSIADGAVITVAGPFDQAVGPHWSADGSFLAFDAPVGEYSQAFLVAPDGSWVRQLTNADLGLLVRSVWTP